MKNKLSLLAFFVLLGALRASAQDTLTVSCYQDYYQANAQLSITVDGANVPNVPPCLARTSSPGVFTGTPTVLTFTGNWGPAAHMVVATFTNDAWGGSPATDRNAYISAVSYDGIQATPVSYHACGLSTTTGAPQPLYCGGDSGTWKTAPVLPPAKPVAPVQQATALGPTGYTLTCNVAGTYVIGPLTLVCSGPGTVHSVTLTWDPVTTCGSPTAPVACSPQYHVYKSTVAGGPYTVLAPSAVTTYVDGAVTSGSTYYYVVTAYLPPCTSGQTTPCGESAYSNQTSATIPTP